MSTDFADTDDKKEETQPRRQTQAEPTLDIFGTKIKVNDAQNLALAVLGIATVGLTINTFYPQLLPFNKPPEKPKEVLEYPQLQALDLSSEGEFNVADVVDRVYSDDESIINTNPKSKKLSYNDVDDIFGGETKVSKRKGITKIESEDLNSGLDISSELF